MRILRIFGTDTASPASFTTVGPEQEYFLVDRELYFDRPDLLTCERTLFGAKPPKGQQLEDHYFGTIPPRVLAFMAESERELYRLGVPVKTRHNEVAPGQYEIAPLFEETHIASDHQMLIMETLKRVAPRYGLQALLHEKPFAGVNGSGKHNNWSMSTDTGVNLLDPQDETHTNMQFLVFLVRRHPGGGPARRPAARLDRVGGQRPPARRQRGAAGDHLDLPGQDADRHPGAGREGPAQAHDPGRHARPRRQDAAAASPPLRRPQPHLARSRSPATSSSSAPWARPPASPGPTRCSTPSWPSRWTTSPASSSGRSAPSPTPAQAAAAVLAVLKRVIKEHKRVIFDGDNYSEEWHAEAERRGLPNLKDSVAAFQVLRARKNGELFKKYGVLNRSEYESRIHIAVEKYVKQLGIEAETMVLIAQIAAPAGGPGAPAPDGGGGGGHQGGGRGCAGHHAGAAGLRGAVTQFRTRIVEVERLAAHHEADPAKHAAQIARELKPAMGRLRETGTRWRRWWRRTCGRCRTIEPCCSSSRSRAERTIRPLRPALRRPPCRLPPGEHEELGRAAGGRQHPCHRLECHALFGRRVGVEIDRERLDQRRPVGPREGVEPGVGLGDPAILQPNPHRAIQPAAHPTQLVQHRLAQQQALALGRDRPEPHLATFIAPVNDRAPLEPKWAMLVPIQHLEELIA